MSLIAGLWKRPERRSYENPKVPLSGATLARYIDGGRETDAGVLVSEQSALQYTAVLTCVKILSESIAVLPLMVRGLGADGSKKPARDHPAFSLVHDAPNPEMSATTWKETKQGHLGTWGDAYSRIEWGTDGQPKYLWPMRPDTTRAVRLENSREVRYVSRLDKTGRHPGNIRTILDPAEVLHVPGLGFNGLNGYSPVGLARQAIGLGLTTEIFDARFFQNGALFAGIFKHPNKLSPEAHGNLRRDLTDNHSGAVNAFDPLIIEEGMEWQQVTLPRDDAMFLGLRKFQKREIAAIYRVPPHLMADLEGGASFASIEQMSLDFVKFSLGIWLTKWQDELRRKLIRGPGVGRFVIEFIVDAFLRGATLERYQAHDLALKGRWKTRNEVRANEGLEPMEGGDVADPPANQSIPAAGANGSGAAEVPADEGAAAEGDGKAAGLAPDPELVARFRLSHRVAVAEAAGRLVRKEVDRIRRNAKKKPSDFGTWAAAFYEKHREAVVDALWSPCEQYVAVMAEGDREAEARALAALSDFADEEIRHVRATAIAAHAGGKTQGLLDVWTIDRPARMAEALCSRVRKAIEE